MLKPLQKLKNIIHEAGLLTNSEFFKNVQNRKRLYSTNPKSFLALNKNGVPVFPVRNQYGGMSMTVLKRSLTAAKRLHRKTGDKRYHKIIDQIKVYLKLIEDKALTVPISYKVGGELQQILNKTRDLGSLSSLGNVDD